MDEDGELLSVNEASLNGGSVAAFCLKAGIRLMEDLHWFDQKTALFIADSLDICERLNELNQKILEQLETAIDSAEELAQLKHLSGDQESGADQVMPDGQNQQDSDRKVIYLLLPSSFLYKHDEFSRDQDEE